MAHIKKIVISGATFKELMEFVEECKSKEIPLDTPLKISQHTMDTLNDVVDMQADEESIIFYDWL